MKIQLEADEALDWIALLNENTEVDLINLNDLVRKKSFKPREEALFFGKALKDSDPTIVHHFSSDELLYPDLEAGIFLSRKLVYNLWQNGEPVLQQKNFPNDFNIDPSYEFAKFVYNDGSGKICNEDSLKILEEGSVKDFIIVGEGCRYRMHYCQALTISQSVFISER